MKKAIKSVGVALMTLPAMALAVEAPGAVEPITGGGGGENFVADTITNIINFILMFAAAIAVLVLVIGGIMYMVSGGSEDKAKTAKGMILAAVIGLVVIILSFVIVEFVKSAIGTVTPS